MKKRKHLRDALLLAVTLILILVLLHSGLRILESTVLHQEQEAEVTSKTIVRDGVAYFPRQDITTMLIMGIDKLGPVEESGSYINTGAADVNILLVFNETEKTCDVLHLNRDTMMEIPVLGLGGRKAGTTFGQLALAHTYGSGRDDSCRNAVEAVSSFLQGVEIDYYLSMHMDAIAILNDAVDGVTVTVSDDFSQVDPTITMGEMTLRGEQAIHYVRTRKDVGDQKNLSRIERHKEYLDGFVEAFRNKQATETEFILQTYDAVKPYIVTNCSANGVSGMADRYGDYTVGDVLTLPGENRIGEKYYEFYPDMEKLDQLILQLFYAPKK